MKAKICRYMKAKDLPMHEGLNHWAFVYAAYGLGVTGTVALVLLSWTKMRRAEARRERTRAL